MQSFLEHTIMSEFMLYEVGRVSAGEGEEWKFSHEMITSRLMSRILREGCVLYSVQCLSGSAVYTK